MAAILSGKRQELGQAPALSTPESPRSDQLTVPFTERNNPGWTAGGKPGATSPGDTRRANTHMSLLWGTRSGSHLQEPMSVP